jgi:hypothetical protein
MTALLDSATRRVARTRSALGHRWRFSGRYEFEDRSKGRERALLVLIGYKPYLWPQTLARVARHVPPDIDVCLVSSGRDLPELRAHAARHGWSYLSTRANQVGVAQNLALQSLPAARMIYKLDEDMFIAEGFFEGLLDGYRRVEAESEFALGFCAPLINLNGFSYVDFLRARGEEAAYRARFGATRRSHDRVPAFASGEAAVWLWERSLPVDEVAATLRAQPFRWSIVPHRFSIGAILFARELWEDMMLGYPRVLKPPGVGFDEQRICVTCLSYSRIMAVVHTVFAGHFAFGSQEAAVRAAFEARLPEF